jgi:hypothetical protein
MANAELRYATGQNPEVVPTASGCMIIARPFWGAGLVLELLLLGSIALVCLAGVVVGPGKHVIFGIPIDVRMSHPIKRPMLCAVALVLALRMLMSVRESTMNVVLEIDGTTLRRVEPGLWGLRIKQFDLGKFERAEFDFREDGRCVMLYPPGDGRTKVDVERDAVYVMSEGRFKRPVVAQIAIVVDNEIHRLRRLPLRAPREENNDE